MRRVQGVAFSLFGRKSKPDQGRARSDAAARESESVRSQSPANSLEAHRELARRTAEKIDRIESEMMSSPSQGESSVAHQPPMSSGGLSRTADPRRVASAPNPPPSVARPPPGSYDLAPHAHAQPLAEPPGQDYSTSVVLGDTYVGFGGIEVSTSSLPPELEEAAILYANDQPAACIATLKAAIELEMPPEWQRQGWLMLLDVLQASGDRAGFEELAIGFAARFERSPPAWVADGTGRPQPGASGPSAATVRFAGRLDVSSAKQFEQARRTLQSRNKVSLDFGQLADADAQGAAAACEFFRASERAEGEITLLNAHRLLAVALAGTEVGRRDPDESLWQLALLAHRLLGSQQQFEELSIDYCVTYEISPPPWVAAAANIRIDADGGVAGEPSGKMAGHQSEPIGSVFHLRGNVVGRMADELAALREFAVDRSEILLDCRDLRRIDFVAAGELLNEVVTFASRGQSVLFVEPSTIVEAMFIVMGLHEVADIRGRKR
jgi:anti-anti-sigma regulatory factor